MAAGEREPMAGAAGDRGAAGGGDRRPGAAMGLIAAGAVGMWLAGRATWLTVATFDDKSGDGSHAISGAAWFPESTALVLTLLAAVGAALILGRLGRRLVGALAALVAAAATWGPVQLLTGGADPDRALSLLQTGQVTQRATDPVTVSDWATVSEAGVHQLPPAAALAAGAVALLGAVLLVMRPGGGGDARGGAYETPEVRRARAREDLAEAPDSGRVLWDALDAGVDPTADDPDPDRG